MNFFKNLSKKQKIILLVAVGLLLVFSFVKTYFPSVGLSSWRSNINAVFNGKPNEAQDKELSVYYVDVGQGDCTFIKTPKGNFLIDTGTSAMAQCTAEYILSQNVDTVEYLVITHPHEDHFGGASRILDFIDVKNIIMPDIPEEYLPEDDGFDYLLKRIKDGNIPVYAARAGDKYQLGDAVFTILSPIKNNSDINEMSVVIRLDFGETSFLFMGDAEKSAEKVMIRKNADLKCDVLKVGHHGSSKGTTDEFLEKTEPLVAVISCGMNNDYGHPAEDLTRRLKNHSVSFVRTDMNGNVIIGSDGKRLYCWYEKGEKY